MNLEEKINILSVITTRDEQGRHFADIYSPETINALEEEGLVEVTRPVHPVTGLEYGSENYTVEVTEDGLDLVSLV